MAIFAMFSRRQLKLQGERSPLLRIWRPRDYGAKGQILLSDAQAFVHARGRDDGREASWTCDMDGREASWT